MSTSRNDCPLTKYVPDDLYKTIRADQEYRRLQQRSAEIFEQLISCNIDDNSLVKDLLFEYDEVNGSIVKTVMELTYDFGEK